jgi:hypothetical protein
MSRCVLQVYGYATHALDIYKKRPVVRSAHIDMSQHMASASEKAGHILPCQHSP